MSEDLTLGVSEFVDLLNQTLDFAYPNVTIIGELANFRVSKNRWVYFDLKDEGATLKCFATVYQLPGPLEDGLLLKVAGQPRLHNLYGFSLNVQRIQPSGEGSLIKAANLLLQKLQKEGLFDEARKRNLPYPPERIGLITSSESAAYADFIKIMNARWGNVAIELIDVQVQGELAQTQIVAAIDQFNAEAQPPEVMVIIRGGGSAEDLAAFNSEALTRAIATSRVPTLVAVGHETDLSLAELAADKRASTPSNAAELLVPERKSSLIELEHIKQNMKQSLSRQLERNNESLRQSRLRLDDKLDNLILSTKADLQSIIKLINAFNPEAVLKRGYAIARDSQGLSLHDVKVLSKGDIVDIQLARGHFKAKVNEL